MYLTLVIVGTGGVLNGWAPVLRAMERAYERPVPPSDKNLPFVSTTWQLRWLHSQLADPHYTPSRRRHVKVLYRQACRDYVRLKRHICAELRAAFRAGELRPSPALLTLRSRLSRRRTVVVTTNWDPVVARVFRGFPIIPLHGTMGSAHSLYLPSETIVEPYRRDTDPRAPHGFLAGTTMVNIEACSRLILCGISLSSFDVELGHVISGGFQGTLGPKRVEVIDCTPAPVVERLRFFLPDLSPSVIATRRVRRSRA